MFEAIAWTSLGLGFLCALIIAIDVARHPQSMGIMNIVWPVTALYGSVLALWAYFAIGREQTKGPGMAMPGQDHQAAMKEDKQHPKLSQIAVAASHCGAGCVIGDILAEFTVFALALTLWGSDLWAGFVLDYLLAWTIGIAFQYFSIVPMRGLAPLAGIWAAIKADTLSISAWQVGMYGWMLLTRFVIFPQAYLRADQAGYWLMMQVAMIVGFMTAYPMNYLLVKTGLKEAMA